MDQKKKISMKLRLLLCACLFSVATSLLAQDVSRIEFCGREYKDGVGNDSITLYLNLFDKDHNKAQVTDKDLAARLHIYEDGTEMVPLSVTRLSGGLRIPKEYTFSVLVDLSIHAEGKQTGTVGEKCSRQLRLPFLFRRRQSAEQVSDPTEL